MTQRCIKPELTDLHKWAVHGVISQCMAQGRTERWIRTTLKKVGIELSWEAVEMFIQEWEDASYEDATEANNRYTQPNSACRG